MTYSVQDSFGADENHELIVMQGQDDVIRVLMGEGAKALRVLKPGEQKQFGGHYRIKSERLKSTEEWIRGFLIFDLVPWLTQGFFFEIVCLVVGMVGLLHFTGTYDDMRRKTSGKREKNGGGGGSPIFKGKKVLFDEGGGEGKELEFNKLTVRTLKLKCQQDNIDTGSAYMKKSDLIQLLIVNNCP